MHNTKEDNDGLFIKTLSPSSRRRAERVVIVTIFHSNKKFFALFTFLIKRTFKPEGVYPRNDIIYRGFFYQVGS